MSAIGFFITAAFLATEVYLTALTPTPLGYALTALVGAMLLFQAALLTQR